MSDGHHTKSHTEFILPSSLITKVDVSRLFSEVERIDNEYIEAGARERVGEDGSVQPVYSPVLAEFLEKNGINIVEGHERGSLVHELRQLKDSLPVVHVTFSSDADGESLENIVTWFRNESHPQTVLSVGLQPSLVAGVYVRTTNKVHDLSLKATLRENRGLLAKELEAIRGN